ncbi:hypothetical protein QQ045_027372 [Rhodiola kirilowii]
MASSRITRFATEVAPAQFVTVMRQRAHKMMDTIQEEEIHSNNTPTPTASILSSSSNSNRSLVSYSPRSPSVASTGSMDRPGGCRRFLKGVQKSIYIFGH